MMLNDILKELRNDMKCTQKEIAEKAEISQIAYIKYESGKLIPPQKTIEKLAAAYNVNPSVLSDCEFDEETAIVRLIQIISEFNGKIYTIKDIKDNISLSNEEMYFISFSDFKSDIHQIYNMLKYPNINNFHKWAIHYPNNEQYYHYGLPGQITLFDIFENIEDLDDKSIANKVRNAYNALSTEMSHSRPDKTLDFNLLFGDINPLVEEHNPPPLSYIENEEIDQRIKSLITKKIPIEKIIEVIQIEYENATESYIKSRYSELS